MVLDDAKYAIERAIINDVVLHEGARIIVADDRAAVAEVGQWKKCFFADVDDFPRYAEKYEIYGNVCLIGAPLDAPKKLGFSAAPCFGFAYLNPMPPHADIPSGITIKRLATSLAPTVLNAYHNPGDSYTVDGMREIMRDKGVFGAIADGVLAGFIGRHGDGNMGMLEVFEPFRRRGIAVALESFLITYIMTFGRTPICDVYTDNPASIELQNKLGLTKGVGYTFWTEIDKSR